MVKVELPLEEAVVEAARQNYERDVRNGLLDEDYGIVYPEYETEARSLLEQTGENFKPEAPDVRWITLSS